MAKTTIKRKTTRNYIEYDFELAKVIGTSATLVLGALINNYSYFDKKHQLKDGKFFNTKEDIGLKTNLQPAAILKAEKLLCKIGYISISKRSGNAGRLNDYTIHFDVINQPLESVKSILETDSTTSKNVINQSKECRNKHEESTMKNKHEELTEKINMKNKHMKINNMFNEDYFNTLFSKDNMSIK